MEAASNADALRAVPETVLPACHAVVPEGSESLLESPELPESPDRPDCCSSSEVALDAPKTALSPTDLPVAHMAVDVAADPVVSTSAASTRLALQKRPPDPGRALFTLHSILII